jgi:hypothetical protein
MAAAKSPSMLLNEWHQREGIQAQFVFSLPNWTCSLLSTPKSFSAQGATQKEAKRNVAKLAMEFLASFIKEKLPAYSPRQTIHVANTDNMCQRWLEKEVVLKNVKWISFDLEARMGPRFSKAVRNPDLIQLSTQTACLVVHVSGSSSQDFPALSRVLFGAAVRKLGKDLRGDAKMLQKWYPAFASLAAHGFSEVTDGTPFVVGCPTNVLARRYLERDFVKGDEWALQKYRWPLDRKLVKYAAHDATLVADVYVAMQRSMAEQPVQEFSEKNHKQLWKRGESATSSERKRRKQQPLAIVNADSVEEQKLNPHAVTYVPGAAISAKDISDEA